MQTYSRYEKVYVHIFLIRAVQLHVDCGVGARESGKYERRYFYIGSKHNSSSKGRGSRADNTAEEAYGVLASAAMATMARHVVVVPCLANNNES